MTLITQKKFYRKDLLLVSLMCINLMIPYLLYITKGMVGFTVLFLLWIVVYSKSIEVSPFFYYSKINWNLTFSIGAFIIINFLDYLFLNDSSKAFAWVLTFIYFLCFLFIKYCYNERELVIVLFYIIISLGINSLISIPYILGSEEYVSRLMASGQLDVNENLDAIKHGVGANGLYTSNVLFVFLGLKYKGYFTGKRKVLFVSSILLILISVLISTFFASVLLLGLGFLIVFLWNINKFLTLKNISFVFFTILVLHIFLQKFYTKLMDGVLFPILFKIELFFTSGQDKDVTGRTELTKSSLNSFMENPFFGVGVPEWQSYKVIGEHMFWVDIFAHFGFFGVLPLLIFIFLLLRFEIYWRTNDVYLFICGFLVIASSFIAPMLVVNNTFIALILFIGLKRINQCKYSI